MTLKTCYTDNGGVAVKNLKTLRDEKGVSQQKLADAIGSNQQSIHRYENGDYEPDILTLSLLADYFDTSIDFLVGRTDIRKRIEPVEEYELNLDEATLVEKFRGLAFGYKKCLTAMLDALIEVAGDTDRK